MNIVKGDMVMVSIPISERKVHTPVAKYNGQVMVVSKRVSRLNGMKVYYELEGAESEYGIPYAFAKEWVNQI